MNQLQKKETLELRIEPLEEMQAIVFNYEELKTGLEKAIEKYKGIIFQEEDIQEAKNTRADLNRLKKTLNDKRLELKKAYSEPVVEFETKIKNLTEIIDEPIEEIDTQIKFFEEKQKEEKRLKIVEIYQKNGLAQRIELDAIFNDRWLNKTFSLTQIENDLKEFKKKYDGDVESIKAMKDKNEIILLEYYKKYLDLPMTLVKKAELEEQDKLLELQRKRREEAEKRKQEIQDQIQEEKEQVAEVVEEVEQKEIELKEEIGKQYILEFKVKGTKDQLQKLVDYMKYQKLEYGRI